MSFYSGTKLSLTRVRQQLLVAVTVRGTGSYGDGSGDEVVDAVFEADVDGDGGGLAARGDLTGDGGDGAVGGVGIGGEGVAGLGAVAADGLGGDDDWMVLVLASVLV